MAYVLQKNNEKNLDTDLFVHPSKEYRGAPFWAWNVALNEDVLKKQIKYFKLKIFYESEEYRLGSYWNNTEFVFKDEDGNSLSPLKPNRWLHKFCEKENLKYVTPHSFRHLCASLMIDSGASVKTVQACLGHSDASTTLNIYAHAFAKAQARASEAVASNFKLC